MLTQVKAETYEELLFSISIPLQLTVSSRP